MTTAILLSIAYGAAPALLQQEYTARLGVPYLLGPTIVVSGSKEELDLGVRRWVTLRSVRTAIAYGMEGRTFVAGEGKMLVILSATIKNPAKLPISVSDSAVFGLRLYDSKLKAGDVKYLGAANGSDGRLDRKLQKGEQVDVQAVYEFPASIPNLRVGTYFDRYDRVKAPKYDLTTLVEKPKSMFAKDALTYLPLATVKAGQRFDLDDLVFKIGAVDAAEGGYKVHVQVENKMPTPGRWGWQYARAELVSETGEITAYYPDFVVVPAFADWRNSIDPGKTVEGVYTFFPAKPDRPKTFILTMNATKRTVRIEL